MLKSPFPSNPKSNKHIQRFFFIIVQKIKQSFPLLSSLKVLRDESIYNHLANVTHKKEQQNNKNHKIGIK